jgi:large subunit ribosomal protein L10
MNRQQKEFAVSDFKKLLTESQATFLINYQGLSVALMQSLRRDIRQNGGLLKVTKARLMKKAADSLSHDFSGLNKFQEKFKNQIGLVFTNKDISATAKKLVEFSKKHEKLQIISGFFDSKVLSNEQIIALASLPSREILLGMLAGTMQAPITSFVRLLNLLIVRLLYVLQRVNEKKNG